MNVETLRELLKHYGLTLHSTQVVEDRLNFAERWCLVVEDKHITVVIHPYAAHQMALIDTLLSAVLEEFTK